MDQRYPFIPPALFLNRKKRSSYLLGTRLWPELELIFWKSFILSDILHLNSSKGKENSILNWSARAIHTYSIMAPLESTWFLTSWMWGLSYYSVPREACKTVLEECCGHPPFSTRRTASGLGTCLLSSHFRGLDSRCRSRMRAGLRWSLCQTGLWADSGCLDVSLDMIPARLHHIPHFSICLLIS